MAKANQKTFWEKSGLKTEPPSKRTQSKGLLKDNGEYSNKYGGKPHNHFPQGKTGYIPK